MKVRVSKNALISLESVAMTDIVMNLFIFFFISFSLLYTFNPNKDKESKIDVKLPEGSANEESRAETPLVITITSGNEIYLGQTRVLPDKLKKELSSRSAKEKMAGVLVRSDKAASVDILVKALDASKQAGIPKLGVAIQQEA